MKKPIVILAALLFSAVAQAQGSKQMRIVVPFPPGGASDSLTRMVGERLSTLLNHQVIVENRAGAGGNLGAEVVYRADPDGMTLLSSPPHILTINHLIYKLNFDPTKFVPVSIMAMYPNVLLATPKLPVSSLGELIALAKKQPGKLNIASQGNGTSTHLTAELFKSLAGVDMVHVPYKGTAPAFADLLGGQVDIMFDNLVAASPHVKAGKLKLLGVGGPKRIDAYPNVPAIAEQLPGFQSETWMALVAPPGTPHDTAARISSAVNKALQDPTIRKRLTDLQAEPIGNTPEQFAEVIRQDTARWSKVIRDAHIRVE